MSAFTLMSGLRRAFSELIPPAYQEMLTGYDVFIKFLSAENLPKMDYIGSTDAYFIAKLDGQITYTSAILANTLSPKWKDEEWIVRNVPLHAQLTVALYDKDDDSLNDDYIGQFAIDDLSNYQAPTNGHTIIGPSGPRPSRFYLTIQTIELSDASRKLPRYTFDGPCRYTRHKSPAIGHLTMLNPDNVYSTWKIQLRRISVFLRPLDRQQWNRKYPIAQSIFDGSARSIAKQNTFKFAHKMLYGSSIKYNESGQMTTADDLWKLIFSDEKSQAIRLCTYTYIIDDYSWRFSETGSGYFTDYASKHALHANCSETVRYAGQFHPRPKFGWDRLDDEWELVFDNKSGTYAPSLDLLDNLKKLLEFNFPGLNVLAYDRENSLLDESYEQLKAAVQKSKRTPSFFNRLVFSPSLPTTNQQKKK